MEIKFIDCDWQNIYYEAGDLKITFNNDVDRCVVEDGQGQLLEMYFEEKINWCWCLQQVKS